MPLQSSRKTTLIVVGSLVALLAVIVFTLGSLNTPLRPRGSETTIVLFGLSILLSLAFVVFAFILVRNIAKLYIERRSRILGSKFKFKLVAGALALSLMPVVFLFYFSYALVNRTMDKWFKQPLETVARGSKDINSLLSDYALRKTQADAGSAAAVLPQTAGRIDGQAMERAARMHGIDYLLWIGPDGKPQAFYPANGADLFHMIAWDKDGKPISPGGREFFADGGELKIAVVPMTSGWLAAGNRLPAELSGKIDEMRKAELTYEQLSVNSKTFRRIYLLILGLVTVIILFITTWVALFLSKQITVPMQHLAAATLEVSQGRLEYRVQTRAVDELGVLVERFNAMTAQLEAQRRQLESSRAQLQGAIGELETANTELDQRTRFTEAILESIPTGVISLSPRREILRINPGVERLLGSERARAAAELRDLFSSEELRELENLLRRSVRMGTVTSQFELLLQGKPRSVAITAASLLHPRSPGGRYKNLGYILVIEDLSDVIYAQQEAAWREVAKRIAHEIKNPLTPIALSAERIRRHLERVAPLWTPGAIAPAPDQPALSYRVMRECTSLIEREVATLKNLVNEFSELARFPKAQPVACNLNGVVENALSVFNGRLEGINIELNLCPTLPTLQIDPDQFKRVIVNLVDNAAEAMEDSPVRELRISTSDLRGETVELVVADTGPGVDAEIKERLFLPYFSTKKRGTGLGLAIVSRMVNENNGSVRVEENTPAGARFIIELPVAATENAAQGSENAKTADA